MPPTIKTTRGTEEVQKSTEGIFVFSVKKLHAMTCFCQVRKGLKLSLSQMGRELGGYSKQAIWNWEHYSKHPNRKMRKKYKMSDGLTERCVQIVSNAVYSATNGRVTIRAKVSGRVWRFTPRVLCVVCGRVFTPERSTTKRCARCRR